MEEIKKQLEIKKEDHSVMCIDWVLISCVGFCHNLIRQVNVMCCIWID